MPIQPSELVRDYGNAVVNGAAALFVGAGLSKDSGLPTWTDLLADLRQEANVPSSVTDLPLAAEYIIQQLAGGRLRLEADVQRKITGASPQPHVGHRTLSRLDIDDVWTTNYDWMIGASDPDRVVVATEDDVATIRTPGRRRLTKMHGSLTPAGEWASDAVISRTDYETYHDSHPRIWASLQATYLTRSFLFLGFSFDDPNVGILLRLSRQLSGSAPKHFTVLKRPGGADELRLHQLRTQDLEQTGIAVCEIDDFTELNPLLSALELRSRRPILFVTGSDAADSGKPIGPMSRLIGSHLADLPSLVVKSFAGSGGMATSLAFNNSLRARSAYDAARTLFLFRQSLGSEAVPTIRGRIGTAIHTGAAIEQMRVAAIDSVRAVLAVGGNARVATEIQLARQHRVPVIAIPSHGGASLAAWKLGLEDNVDLDASGRAEVEPDWANLNDSDELVVAQAATRLVRRIMFIDAD